MYPGMWFIDRSTLLHVHVINVGTGDLADPPFLIEHANAMPEILLIFQ